MNWIEGILIYWKEFALLASPIAGWFLGRKSNDIKLKTDGAGAISALQNIYDKYIEHNSAITKELTTRVNQIEHHNRELQDAFNKMHLSYAIVMGENQKLEARYKQLEKEYEQLKVQHNALKKAFDEYKKNNKISNDSTRTD